MNGGFPGLFGRRVERRPGNAKQSTLLGYHQFRARLGMGDLHPGGASATATMLCWLTERRIRRVLEVGAGIGNTAARMAALGWDVTALEPDQILFSALHARLGKSARREPFLAHATTAPYDAIVAESVFFQMDVPQLLAHASKLLRPGGYLAFVEAIWTDRVTARTSRELSEQTQRLFGIAVGARERLTWTDWSRHLGEAGFETVHAQLLPRGSAGHPPTSNLPASAAAIARDPRLLLWMARYRLRKHRVPMPPGAQESWLYLGRTAERP